MVNLVPNLKRLVSLGVRQDLVELAAARTFLAKSPSKLEKTRVQSLTAPPYEEISKNKHRIRDQSTQNYHIHTHLSCAVKIFEIVLSFQR